MATCEACAAGIGTMPNPIGDHGEGIGTCMNCHSHACGDHGHRDANVPEFICVECDPSLLVASAAVLGRDQGLPTPASLDAAARTYHRYPESGPWVVRSVEEWQTRHGGYGRGLAQSVSASDWPGPDIVRNGTLYGPQIDLVMAADYIRRSLEIPSDRLAPALRSLFTGRDRDVRA